MAHLGQILKTTVITSIRRVIPIWTNEYSNSITTAQEILNIPVNARIEGDVYRVETGQPYPYQPMILFYPKTLKVIAKIKTDSNGHYRFNYLNPNDQYTVIVSPIDSQCNSYIYRNITPVT